MDISMLRERKLPFELSVSELNDYIRALLENDRTLAAISVRGEISNFTYHRSGHLYFSLKDENSQIKAVMFRSSAQSLRFVLENGMKVIVRCSVGVYSQGGIYQLYVTSIQPDGIGALYLAYEQLKKKLESEGLFSPDFKKELPKIPNSVGIITSPTGAAIRDIINILNRRFPIATVYLYPSLVQGERAEENLIEGLEFFENSGLADVVIIGRGGGSIEDLWAFNGERLARKIFECKIPIISAVGHETDFTICDFVADLRAPTPSAAAELAAPDKNELMLKLDSAIDRALSGIQRRIYSLEQKYISAKSSSIFKNPDKMFNDKKSEIDEIYKTSGLLLKALCDKCEAQIKYFAGKLDSLSPLSVIKRGYSVIYKSKSIVKSVASVKKGEQIDIKLSDGMVKAEVLEKRKSR